MARPHIRNIKAWMPGVGCSQPNCQILGYTCHRGQRGQSWLTSVDIYEVIHATKAKGVNLINCDRARVARSYSRVAPNWLKWLWLILDI